MIFHLARKSTVAVVDNAATGYAEAATRVAEREKHYSNSSYARTTKVDQEEAKGGPVLVVENKAAVAMTVNEMYASYKPEKRKPLLQSSKHKLYSVDGVTFVKGAQAAVAKELGTAKSSTLPFTFEPLNLEKINAQRSSLFR